MSDSPWSQFIRRQQKSYTRPDEDIENSGDKFYKPSVNTTKWTPSETSQEDQSSPIFGKPRSRMSQVRYSRNQTQIQTRTSIASRPSITSTRGNITNRTGQKPEKTTRQLSRDIEKVQRIIEIDNDILKSQINNLNSDLKIKKDNIEIQNRILLERTNKLEALVLEERKQKVKFNEMFEKSMNYFKDKFNEQSEINDIYAKEIQSLKGTIRLLESNKVQTLDKSTFRKESSPMTRRTSEESEKQKYIEKIKILQFQLKQKNKQLQGYQQNPAYSMENSLTFEIQRNNSFCKVDKQTKQVLTNCEQLYSLCQTLNQQPLDHAVLDALNYRIRESISFFKQMSLTHQISQISSNSSFKKSSTMTDRSTDKLFEERETL